jgi:hypothetical protein
MEFNFIYILGVLKITCLGKRGDGVEKKRC